MSTLTVQKEVEQTEMMTAPTLLKAEDINIYYGENHAVKNLNLAVHRNEILALIGPSGCGKSTFLRSINRMNDLIPSARVTGT